MDIVSRTKRDFRRNVREVRKQLEVLSRVNDAALDEGLVMMARRECEEANVILDEYGRSVAVFGDNVADEEALNLLVTAEDEEKMLELRLMVRSVLSKVAYYEGMKNKETENQDRQDEHARMEAQTRIQELKIQSDERVRLEEVRLARVTLERVGQKSSAGNLPIINLMTFDGQHVKFQEWWDNFNALVHSKTDLDECRKFHYLRSVVTGQALKTIEGIRITNDNYHVARGLLKEKFGVDQVVICKLYDDVMNLRPKTHLATDLHSFFCEIEVLFRLLDNQICDLNNEILITNVLRKLPNPLLEELYNTKGVNVNMEGIRDFFRQKSTTYERIATLNSDKTNVPQKFDGVGLNRSYRPKVPQYGSHQFTGSALVSQNTGQNGNIFCVFCDGQHESVSCELYPTYEDRQSRVRNRCFICLNKGHQAVRCSRKYLVCNYCERRGHHNSAICQRRFSVQNGNATSFFSGNRVNSNNTSEHPFDNKGECEGIVGRNTSAGVPTVVNNVSNCTETNLCAPSLHKKVYLQTATVYVTSADGKSKRHLVRIVLDTGSSNSYISQGLFEKLNLKREYVRDINVFTFGEKGPKAMNVFGARFCLVDKSGKSWEIDANVVPTIVGSVPQEACDVELMENIAQRYELADTYLTHTGTQALDVLIGNDYYSDFILNGKIPVLDSLYLLDTVFGYVLSGKVSMEYTGCSSVMANTSLFIQVDSQVKYEHDVNLFWKLETIGITEDSRVTEDDLALENFNKTLRYTGSRYYVSFPWRDKSKSDLQNNFGLALGRLNSLVKRHKNDGILDACKNTFDEQLRLGILENVKDSIPHGSHYLPYHAVIRKESEHTKVRFVMDASCRQNKTKHSLNELLYRGPVLLENLCSILIRFRFHRYGVIADLEKAFLNIGLNEEDRDFTRILWVKDPGLPATGDNLLILRHTRIPFGVTCSPFLLMGVINHHLSNYPGNETAEKLKHNLYVDNFVSGVDTEGELGELVCHSRELFSKGSLNLRQWSTSCTGKNFDVLPDNLKSSKIVQNVLGMEWNTVTDTLHVKNNLTDCDNCIVTKRVLLSVYGSFFDIMGLWAPVTVALKLIIQSTWLKSKGWDEEIDECDKVSLLNVVEDFKAVSLFPTARFVSNILTKNTQFELHAFSDACMTAYGAVVYIRCVNCLDMDSKVLFSKVRIAPTDKPTLPRLELLGVLIACRALIFVHQSLGMTVSMGNVYLWTDNQCVLHWIHSDKVLPLFVKNRINEIKSNKLNIKFRYVPTDVNPADILCRGESLSSLKDNGLWWNGPDWLSKSEDNWPDNDIGPCYNQSGDVESSVEIGLVNTSSSDCQQPVRSPPPAGIDENRFSCFQKLLRTTCYVIKFVNNIKKKGEQDSRGKITVGEIAHARVLWLRYLQGKRFFNTIQSLNRGQRDSLARNLGLELDSDSLLVCKGRFLEAQVTNESPFPVLLPREEHLTNIIISDIHSQCYHMGTNTTLSMLRRQYWVPQGRSCVKSVLHRCPVCKKMSVRPYMTPEFSFYPDYRVNRNVAFSNAVGMDYFGPFFVKENSQVKAVFGLIFSCLTVRAVHFELVESESAADLVLAFRRFVARCGACKLILSDNAQQFRTLKSAVQCVQNMVDLQEVLCQKGVMFQSIPSLSPWAGGCYERLISIAKQCLRKSLGKSTLTFRQLETLLTEVQYVINCRPLGYCSEEDLVITPNHFLGIKRDSLFDTVDIASVSFGSPVFRKLIEQWKKGNHYLKVFWDKWSSQYLQSLRERNNILFKQGKVSSVVPQVGDVVLIKVNKQGRSQWPYGRIESLNTGRDNRIRSCVVRQASGRSIERPVSMLFPFECYTPDV
uniref:Integrase catalytic domain-containing protein n=1 Tax=Cacopsylla melanoneura TaxID=428564 RepID=A0A8D8XYX2_9HEMI